MFDAAITAIKAQKISSIDSIHASIAADEKNKNLLWRIFWRARENGQLNFGQ
jgi:hypothetical protein